MPQPFSVHRFLRIHRDSHDRFGGYVTYCGRHLHDWDAQRMTLRDQRTNCKGCLRQMALLKSELGAVVK